MSIARAISILRAKHARGGAHAGIGRCDLSGRFSAEGESICALIGDRKALPSSGNGTIPSMRSRLSDKSPSVVGFPGGIDWVERRTAAMFSELTIGDPWERLPPKPFTIGARELLRRASRQPRPGSVRTVSGFSDWVYSLYRETGPKPSSLADGIDAEGGILKFRQLLVGSPKFARISRSGWTLVHNGMLATEERESYEIPALGLVGSPDLVFAKDDWSQVIIVEIKFTRHPVPVNLWPNVWAQLWAYSQIPEFSTVPKVLVVGEVWTDQANFYGGLDQALYLRRSVTRDPTSPDFHEFFGRLFQIYSSAESRSR